MSKTLAEKQAEMRERVHRGWDRKRGCPVDGRHFRRQGGPRGSEMAIASEKEKDVEVLARQARFMAGRNFSQARIANQLGVSLEEVERLLSEVKSDAI